MPFLTGHELSRLATFKKFLQNFHEFLKLSAERYLLFKIFSKHESLDVMPNPVRLFRRISINGKLKSRMVAL